MALKNPAGVNSLASLTEDAKKHLDGMKGELDQSDKNLDALEELGLDVSKLREKIRWARKARETIIKTMS